MIPRWFRGIAPAVVAAVALCAVPAHSGEWIAHHDVIFPPGAPSLAPVADPDGVFLAGPATPDDRAEWAANLDAWRKERRNELGLRDDQYARPDLAWTRRAFTQDEVLVWDRTFYDAVAHRYTVDRFLDDVERRFGPLDSVLIWPAYPNLGVDERNQLDLVRDLPGGLPALRAAVDAFHRRGVRVLFPYLAWDTGTHRDPLDDATAFARLIASVDGDGVNFDGLDGVPETFRSASDAIGHPLALEPQFETVDASLRWSQISWNDWVTWETIPYPAVPMVSEAKLLEPAHMTEVTDRYTRDKTDSLQHAFFNGQGYALLENLWGYWAGFSDRDAETVLRTTRIERAFAGAIASPAWEPHVPVLQPGVYASRFPDGARTLWTFVNRRETGVEGEQLTLPVRSGARYFDLWHGVELTPDVRGGAAYVSFAIEPLGYGALLETTATNDDSGVRALLASMAQRSQRALRGYDGAWHPSLQTMDPIAPTALAHAAPAGMVRIPGGAYDFVVHGNEVENGYDPGVDVQFPWETSPRRDHRHVVRVAPFYIDRTPVTNAEFRRFLDATHYRPADGHNFLRDWRDGNYPAGWAKKPVTWVALEDARAYAAWAGKRLPHDWEWQRAAQGDDGRRYPWGADWDAARVPPVTRGNERPAPADVDAFPAGASPYGVLDLDGDVGQWTDTFADAHTRAAIVRGAASYRPVGSVWYFPQTDRLDEHEKFLLMDAARDRAGTIGFRCVVDAAE
jgi:formylglycine-generating enzyme required for sulfatase activity